MEHAKGFTPGTRYERMSVEALREAVQELRDQVEQLEAERNHLLKENRRLRREITQSRLVEELQVSTGVMDDETAAPASVPPTAEDLYHTLPTSFTYDEFFQIAENAGLDTEEIRQSLRIFLRRGMVTQEGSRLKKDATTLDVDERGSSPFSRLAA